MGKEIFYFILLPALLPVFLVFRKIYSLDKVEREPLGFVLKVLIMGAVFSVPCAFIEQVMEGILQSIYDVSTIKYAWMEYTFGVALVEELSKYLVLMISVWSNDNFDYRYDGIVYGTTASLGFAALENVLYVMNFGTGISFGRAIFSIPGHATFGVFMGYYLSRGKHLYLNRNLFGTRFFQILALIVPMLIHGAYDFLLSEQVVAAGYNYIFFIFVIILDIWAWKVIKHEFRTDRRL